MRFLNVIWCQVFFFLTFFYFWQRFSYAKESYTQMMKVAKRSCLETTSIKYYPSVVS